MTYRFHEFEVDTRRRELRRAGERCRVEPQVFDVIAHLLRHRDRVVSKQELLEEVWGHRFVSESTLSSRVMAARRVMGDDGAAQRLIKTLHGRGFRFVAEVEESTEEFHSTVAPHWEGSAAERGGARGLATREYGSEREGAPPLVARGPELEFLETRLEEALRGARRTVFISGEPGIGRTALVEAFAARALERGDVGIAIGRCVDQRGAGEPYLPVLEALGRLCQTAGGAELVDLLHRRAPTWLAQMPALVSPEEMRALQDRIRVATRERMLREMVDALEEWSVRSPLLLLLEDLHWSDPSTLHLIDCLARRSDAARLLVVGTYRSAEAAPGDHVLSKLVQELQVHRLSAELRLRPLSEAGVRELLSVRFPRTALPEVLPQLLFARTEGNPLFARLLLDAWIDSGLIASGERGVEVRRTEEDLRAAMPETLRQLIDQQVEQLEIPDQEILEAASVAGMEFSSAGIAAALQMEIEAVEIRCDALARQRRFLRAAELEEWPDGTLTAGYAFRHHLQREALYRRFSEARRARLHRQIGLRLEAAHANGSCERAGELALHFRLGRDAPRAISYLQLAAQQALARSAPGEAIEHLHAALDLLRRGEVAGIVERELTVLKALGPALVLTRGWSDPEAESVFTRAHQLACQLGDSHEQASVLYGLATLHEIRGEYTTSQALIEQRLTLPLQEEEEIESNEILACSLFHQGLFSDSLERARRGLNHFDPDRHDSLLATHGANPGISCHYWAGLALWFIGLPDAAEEEIRTALRLGAESSFGHAVISPELYAARLYQQSREPEQVVRHASVCRGLAEAQGYAFHAAFAAILLGWARAALGDPDAGIEEIRAGMGVHDELGARIVRPYCQGLLAESLGWAGRVEQALGELNEALALIGEGSRSFYWEAELHRLRGELLLRLPMPRVGAEASFLRALECARAQGARMLELRAAASLGELWRTRGRSAEALALVAEPLGRIHEGSARPDLVRARALLDQLTLEQGTTPVNHPHQLPSSQLVS